MPSDTIIVNGKTYTLGYAVHRGWANPDGTLTRQQAAAEVIIEGIEPDSDFDPADVKPLTRGQMAAATRAKNKAAKPVEPLKPRNVDHSGKEITDQATLDAIAAKTLAMEEEKKAALVIPAAGEGEDASE